MNRMEISISHEELGIGIFNLVWEKVYFVRTKLEYSQERLAQELHVSFATANRWENEKSLPWEMAVILFTQFYEENNIVFYDQEEEKDYVANK